MSHSRHKPIQPILTRTRHRSPIHEETFEPKITVLKRGDRWESILCQRNGCQRFYAESADIAEQRALAVVNSANANCHFRNFKPAEKYE